MKNSLFTYSFLKFILYISFTNCYFYYCNIFLKCFCLLSIFWGILLKTLSLTITVQCKLQTAATGHGTSRMYVRDHINEVYHQYKRCMLLSHCMELECLCRVNVQCLIQYDAKSLCLLCIFPLLSFNDNGMTVITVFFLKRKFIEKK